jgi:hypothetical protein
MRTGYPEFLHEWRWRGRRYLGGLIFGLWVGIVLGVLLSRQLPVPDRSLWLFPLIMMASVVVGLVSRWISGPPRKIEAESHSRDG